MEEINVLENTTYRLVGVVDSFKSVIWTDRYNEYGDFEIYISASGEMVELLKPDYFLYAKETEHMMIVEDFELESDVEEGNYIKITGRSLESMLDRRIVWEKTVLTGNFQNAVKQLLNDAIISPKIAERKIDNFIFKESEDERITSLTMTDTQYTGDTLYKVISDKCKEFNVGFKITMDEANNFIFELYMGEDRSYYQDPNPYVVFSPSFDNIVDSDYIRSISEYKNVTLVAGEEKGTARKTAVVGDTTITGLARRELYTDARDVTSMQTDGTTIPDAQYLETLKTRGVEKLAECKITTLFDGEVDTTRMYQYKKDFYMGDIVELENLYKINSRVRITEFIYSTDQNGTSEYPGFEVIEEEKEDEEGEE